jgi:hypothetical protein
MKPPEEKNARKFELQAKKVKNAGCWGQISNFLEKEFQAVAGFSRSFCIE